MKKIARRMSVLLLLTIMMSQAAFAEDTHNYVSTYEKKKYLIEKGYDEDIIVYLSEKAIDSVYHRVKEDFHGQVMVSAQVSFSRGMSNDVLARGSINKTQLEIRSVMNNYMNDSGEIVGCELIIFYDWMMTPVTNGKDAITVNWDSKYFSLAEEGGFNGYSVITNSETENEEFFNFDMKVDALNSGGAGWNIHIFHPDIEKVQQMNPKGQMILFFEPNYTFYGTDNIVTRFTTVYSQNKAVDNSEITFTRNGTGVQTTGAPVDTLRNVIQYVSNMVDISD